MADDMAVATVNAMRQQMAGLARAIVTALADGKVTTTEGMPLGMRGMMLSMRGMTLATQVLSLLETATPEERHAILHVLEHGTITMSA